MLILVALAMGTGPARAEGSGLPSFAELERAGARIGEVRISAQDIFDTSDPREDKWLFRWANRLHIETRPEVIRHSLLFAPGEPVSVRVIEETERVLRSLRFLYDVHIRPVAVHDGIVDIEVVTRDTWSLDPGLSASRQGGANTTSVQLQEYNLLGTGIALGIGRSKSVDRSSTDYSLSSNQVLGTWTSMSFLHATNSDGKRNAASVVRPFYELDARWTAGVTASDDDRIDAVYAAGKVASEFRRRERHAEIFAGWSPGLVNGWVHRTTLGVRLLEDRYAPEPGLVAPPALPADRKLVAPFVRYELIEDRYERELNRNLIGRPEFFALGLASRVQLGYASESTGSTARALLYAASVSRGFEPAGEQTLIGAAQLSGEYSEGTARRQQLGVLVQYYRPQSPRRLFYASAGLDVLTRPDPTALLPLGGDNGLRGYPLRYQNGTRRALFTVEQRFYTDLYVWQLFRIGGAAFLDVGRAWGGDGDNSLNPRWLGDAGAGLRIVSARSAFSNVIHVDLAFPFNATPDIKKVQLLVKTKTSF